MKTIKARKMTAEDLDSLAMSILDNIKDTPANAWIDLDQAIRMHEDTASEMAVDSHGKRLTVAQWKRVAAFALRVGNVTSEIRIKFVAFVQNGRQVAWTEVTTQDLIATVQNFKGHTKGTDLEINAYECARATLDKRCGRGTSDSYRGISAQHQDLVQS